jgi:peptide/nickel transport system substrate-binding protein
MTAGLLVLASAGAAQGQGQRQGTAQARGQAQPLTTESPLLSPDVAAGRLPPMAARVPATPRVVTLAALGRASGQHGGQLRMVMADQRDIRMMTVYGYARLIGFTPEQDLVPDILAAFEDEDSRRFTLTLRDGHRWSDGHPFTSADFLYWWEDVANNQRLSPGGPPQVMVPEGLAPVVEALDERRIRYTWPVPNPGFPTALAGAQPLYIQMPAHYLKQFHTRHADKAALAEAVKKHRVKDWGALHEQKSRQYRPDNPELPTLEPWRNRTAPPAERFVFERNPFFHRVDETGRQLPYIDQVIINTASAGLIPAKVGAGDSDLQARYLRFDNYTFLKKAEERRNFDVRLWRRSEGAQLALFPNLNAEDEGWRAVIRDKRFRQALSLAINRKDINNVIYYGLAKAGTNAMIEGSKLYDAAQAQAFADHNVARANALLDAAGLDRRDWDRVRLLPDGRRAEITIETAGESSEETDSIELIAENLRDVGLRLFARSAPRELFRRKILIGQTILSLSQGFDNGVATPDMPPDFLAPMSSAQYHWPRFGQFVESNGRTGALIDMPEVQALLDLRIQWRHSGSAAERATIWRKMLAIHAEHVFTIGIVNSALQPVVVSRRLRNVPVTGLFGFDPGGFFGMHLPDTFWFSDAAAQS